MRRLVIGLVVAAAAGLGLVGIPAAIAGAINADIRVAISNEGAVQLAQYGGGNHCARLRSACESKAERGEGGEGNCRRYRSECGERVSHCQRLQAACANKEQRGEGGQGNCREYRAQCGGSQYGYR